MQPSLHRRQRPSLLRRTKRSCCPPSQQSSKTNNKFTRFFFFTSAFVIQKTLNSTLGNKKSRNVPQCDPFGQQQGSLSNSINKYDVTGLVQSTNVTRLSMNNEWSWSRLVCCRLETDVGVVGEKAAHGWRNLGQALVGRNKQMQTRGSSLSIVGQGFGGTRVREQGCSQW